MLTWRLIALCFMCNDSRVGLDEHCLIYDLPSPFLAILLLPLSYRSWLIQLRVPSATCGARREPVVSQQRRQNPQGPASVLHARIRCHAGQVLTARLASPPHAYQHFMHQPVHFTLSISTDVLAITNLIYGHRRTCCMMVCVSTRSSGWQHGENSA